MLNKTNLLSWWRMMNINNIHDFDCHSGIWNLPSKNERADASSSKQPWISRPQPNSSGLLQVSTPSHERTIQRWGLSMHQRHHDLPAWLLDAVGAFLIPGIQKRPFLVTFCFRSAWGSSLKWSGSSRSLNDTHVLIDSASLLHSSLKRCTAIPGIDQVRHDSVKCPFSKQPEQHVDTTTLSCLCQTTCVRSALPMLHVVEQEATTSPRGHQQSGTNTCQIYHIANDWQLTQVNYASNQETLAA